MNIMMITIIDIQHQNNSQAPQNISGRSVRRAKSPGADIAGRVRWLAALHRKCSVTASRQPYTLCDVDDAERRLQNSSNYSIEHSTP